ncbi:hypothetical protein F5051DRAFT_134182 [Lentinula edodes]|nr:hypothetical protein F5051DRAFT_134182 [Lentinula edodes]
MAVSQISHDARRASSFRVTLWKPITMNLSLLSPSSALQILWACYVENLWSYKPNSVVAKAAYSFKVLALALLLPILILILLLSLFKSLSNSSILNFFCV